ncbi:MCE family protein [Nonomuraea sp. WAC 01424]|uniref:MlaD family protein n=1 Tax=Nonomuraea sp. WAC 01424 TaxID=2203200 RepID=UPI000F7A7FB0|nr:MCE family protein [Nonomuraea sp. WAC 01424]RSN16234.1 MCE family protein [Nonomuraea sp. WAC 01424]
MRNRVYLNLGFFVLLGVVMTIWAFSTIIKLDAIERPYRVSAEFASSPGLVRGFDVAYLGVRVGRIGDVRLAPGKIVVGLDIDREIRLPKGGTAEVRRKSAVGEPYVELSPPATGVTGATLAAGDTIPLGRTAVPLDYRKLFEGVGKLLDAVPPGDARTITHELATALDGRAPAIRDVIEDAHDLTGTLADDSQALEDLSVQLTRLTHTLAGRKDALASGITDLSAVTGSLRASRTDLNAFLDQGPGVFAQLDAAIRKSRPGLSCLLTAAGLPHRPVFSAETAKNVHHLLSVVPTALSLAGDISERRGDTVYGKASFVFSVPGGPTPAEEYAGALGPPRVPRLTTCPRHATADTSRAARDTGPHPDAAARPTGGPQDTPGRPQRKGSPEKETVPSPSSSGGVAAAGGASRTRSSTTPLIAAIFLAVVAAGGIVGWIAAGRAARRREESP